MMFSMLGGMLVLSVSWLSWLVVSGDSFDIFSMVVLLSVRYGVVFYVVVMNGMFYGDISVYMLIGWYSV